MLAHSQDFGVRKNRAKLV